MEGKKMMVSCDLCKSTKIEKIHSGTRDNPEIDVLRCNACGLKFLSKQIVDEDQNYYEDSKMRQLQKGGLTIEERREKNKKEDRRKAEAVKEYCMGKRVLDFGCGTGGGVEFLSQYAEHVSGVELGELERQYLLNRGIDVRRDIREFEKGQFDVITLFHVIEHLQKPQMYLRLFQEYLKKTGYVILETPNADDALLELYQCKSFADYTYWSPHIYLYNFHTIELLAKQSGYRVAALKQQQRYPLSNHLYWLSKGMPGGHEKWDMFQDSELERLYSEKLEKLNQCDTILAVLTPN